LIENFNYGNILTERKLSFKKVDKLKIEELQPGQEIVIIKDGFAWPIKVERVNEDKTIFAMDLTNSDRFVIGEPESMEPMKGKEIFKSILCVKCPKKQKFCPITSCFRCYRFVGKTHRNYIICEQIKPVDTIHKE